VQDDGRAEADRCRSARHYAGHLKSLREKMTVAPNKSAAM
jgi:hypothetical protein